MRPPAQSKLRGALEVIDYLTPEWEQTIIKMARDSGDEITVDFVMRMRAAGEAMAWLKSKINSELQPVDNSTPGDLS